jgi:hypothetical protein
VTRTIVDKECSCVWVDLSLSTMAADYASD